MASETSSKESVVYAALASIASVLREMTEPQSGRSIKVALAKVHPRAALEAGLKKGIEDGVLVAVGGPRGAQLYSVDGTVSVPPSRVASQASQPLQDEDDGPVDEPVVSGATLTRRELAELLGTHMQTITKWERDGLPIAQVGRKGKPSRYSEAAVRVWLADREEKAQTSGVVDVARERARKDRAQAVLAEQTYAIRNRDLLPRQDVEKVWAAEIGAVRTKLLSWSTTISDRVHRAGTLTGLVGVEREIREAVEDVLRELADPDRILDPDESDEEQAEA